MAETSDLTIPPALSTPDDHLFSKSELPLETSYGSLKDPDLRSTYEIARTADEIYRARWTVAALQFPDGMLRDAPRVVVLLEAELAMLRESSKQDSSPGGSSESVQSTIVPPGKKRGSPETSTEYDVAARPAPTSASTLSSPATSTRPPKLYILADTSYSPCCVDEVAASHVSASGVVHYGRTCLTPTTALPVLHVYTRPPLGVADVVRAFKAEFQVADDVTEKDGADPAELKVVVAADLPYAHRVPAVVEALHNSIPACKVGVVGTEVVRDPAAAEVPNRRVQWPEAGESGDGVDGSHAKAAAARLKDYALFHIGTPPQALLLALTPRFKSLHVLPVPVPPPSTQPGSSQSLLQATAARLLARRYPKVLAAAAAGIIGILVNTLSGPAHLSVLSSLRGLIARAGKKSYTVVVGRVNPAKLANYAEIEAWVAVGCWESGLVEEGGDADVRFFRPVVTPFELEVALKHEAERIWGASWWAGTEGLVERVRETEASEEETEGRDHGEEAGDDDHDEVDGGVDGEESAPPEFDLRTGKFISTSRPMRTGKLPRKGRGKVKPVEGSEGAAIENDQNTRALARRQKNEVAAIKGVLSPGAEFLRTQRTWTGLGSDFESGEASAVIEEGRSGIARGYSVGENQDRH